MALSDKVVKALDKLGEHQPDLRDKDAAAKDQNLNVGTAIKDAIAEVGGEVTPEAAPTDLAIVDVADIALSTSDTYTDADVNGAVNAAILEVNGQLAAIESKLNELIAALVTAGVLT